MDVFSLDGQAKVTGYTWFIASQPKLFLFTGKKCGKKYWNE